MYFNEFDYPLKLHHTQTPVVSSPSGGQFDYPLKLHHTQTINLIIASLLTFDYPLKLHHTQTNAACFGDFR